MLKLFFDFDVEGIERSLPMGFLSETEDNVTLSPLTMGILTEIEDNGNLDSVEIELDLAFCRQDLEIGLLDLETVDLVVGLVPKVWDLRWYRCANPALSLNNHRFLFPVLVGAMMFRKPILYNFVDTLLNH